MKKKVFIIATEHFDLMWRRAFDRHIEFEGENYISYADIEGYYIMDCIKLCEKYPEYKFEIECVAVLKKFLEKNPQYEDKIKELLASGRLYIPFSGNNIVDSNMTQGESIIRNYLSGYTYLKDKYNYIPKGMDRNDTFGQSAQIPQIARKFGTEWVYHIAYTPCKNEYWKGIDDTCVYVADNSMKSVAYCGGYYKYRPCRACKGYTNVHCDVCNDRRIDTEFMEKKRKFPPILDEEYIKNNDIPGYVYVGGEEILPISGVPEWARKMSEQYDISFINYEDYVPYFQNKLDVIDNPPKELIAESPECNCNNTGCLVTRIKTKQRVRELENRLYSIENLAVLNMLSGKAYPKNTLDAVWEKLFFAMFHDAITATHVDTAYYEMMDEITSAHKMLDFVEDEIKKVIVNKNNEIISVYNPYGISFSTVANVTINSDCDIELTDNNGNAVVFEKYTKKDGQIDITFATGEMKPFETKCYKITETKDVYTTQVFEIASNDEGVAMPILTNEVFENNSVDSTEKIRIENEYYLITASKHGIEKIFDKKNQKVIMEESDFMIGEWILEHDEGSPWATLSPDMRRTSLACDTTLISAEKTKHVQKLNFFIKPGVVKTYSVGGLLINYSVSLVSGCDMVKFDADVWWDNENNRLRLAFPTTITGKNIYEIPYGTLERNPYEPNILYPDNSSNWASAAGDYPAINWAGIDNGDISIALFNKGTPSYQINKDNQDKENIYLSVLRSPNVGTYLHAPEDYSMTDYDGMRDVGNHHFEYAIKSYKGSFAENNTVGDGIGYNAYLFAEKGTINTVELPELICDNARIAAVKKCEKSDDIAVRVVEQCGCDKTAKIKLPEYVKSVWETDLKEDVINELIIKDNTVEFELKHFEIKTLLFKLA